MRLAVRPALIFDRIASLRESHRLLRPASFSALVALRRVGAPACSAPCEPEVAMVVHFEPGSPSEPGVEIAVHFGGLASKPPNTARRCADAAPTRAQCAAGTTLFRVNCGSFLVKPLSGRWTCRIPTALKRKRQAERIYPESCQHSQDPDRCARLDAYAQESSFPFQKVAGFEALNFDHHWLVLSDRRHRELPPPRDRFLRLPSGRSYDAAEVNQLKNRRPYSDRIRPSAFEADYAPRIINVIAPQL